MLKGVFLALVIVLVAAFPGTAGIVFNTFGSGDTYSTVSYTIGPFIQGSQFSPSATGALSEIDVAFGRGGGDDLVTISLMTDSGGSPGSLVEGFTFHDTTTSTNPGAVFGLFSSLNPVLTAGANYWLLASVAGGSSQDFWHQNSIGSSGPTFIDGIMYNNVVQPGTLGAFRVIETDAAPEPGAFGLLVLGGVALGALRRKISR